MSFRPKRGLADAFVLRGILAQGKVCAVSARQLPPCFRHVDTQEQEQVELLAKSVYHILATSSVLADAGSRLGKVLGLFGCSPTTF